MGLFNEISALKVKLLAFLQGAIQDVQRGQTTTAFSFL